jgi:2-oxoisovalerate dehydrogenase E1 component
MLSIDDRQITFNRAGFSNEYLVDIYRKILLPRLIEEKMLILLRQGKISKWFSGFGQEAISVGATMAMTEEEYILPMHRNLGMFTTRGLPLERLFAQFQGKAEGFTKGRDRSFHFGTNEYHLVGMISHLGPQLGVADGIALANKLIGAGKATLVVTGDGGASEGDFHEALNVAAVWQLPVIFLIENNGYGLSTPSNEQFRCKQFIDKGIGYGIDAVQLAGNNILEVISGINAVAEQMRANPRPFIVECITFRMRGHEEASGTKYYPEGIQDHWSAKDPVVNFEKFLLAEQIISQEFSENIRKQIKEEIEHGLNLAYDFPEITPNEQNELSDVFAPFKFQTATADESKKSEKRLIDAVSDGLRQSMEKHSNLILMGQDIAEYGGVFKVTEGFVEQFGKDRVRNTPLCESAILGAGLGLSIKGMKAMVEMQFADFVSEGITQITNNLAKIHYRWGQNADVVVRMPTGAGVAAGPFHSQSNEAWFFSVPGLKIAYPAFPYDAKGLLISAFEDPNPVIFFEHKALYRSIKQEIPDGYYNIEFGKAAVIRQGDEFSFITYGMGVHWALNWLDEHPEVKADVVDLRTLAPLDTETIYTSVRKTGRALVLHEDNLTGGIGGELSALITEHCFESLDAPVLRCASLDSPVPFAPILEVQYLASKKLNAVIEQLRNY